MATTRKKVPEKVEGGSVEREAEAKKRLNSIASEVYETMSKAMIPQMGVPLRTKGNIVFDDRSRVWKYGEMMSSRSAKSLDGAYMLLRTMCTIDFINEMINVKKSSTLREMYYISEGWGIGKFHSEDESNKLVEDLEITTRLMREDFKLRPEENGASIMGNITIEETVRTGASRVINCRDDVGDAGYGIPYNVEREKIRFKSHDAKFVIGIECLDGKENIVIKNSGHVKNVKIGDYIDAAFSRTGELTRKGNSEYINTSEGNINALSLSDDGKLDWKKVTKLIRHDVSAPRVKLTTRYGFNVTVTPNHYVLCYDDFSIVPKKITEIKESDLVAVASSVPGQSDERSSMPTMPTFILNTAEIRNILNAHLPTKYEQQLMRKLNDQKAISYAALRKYLAYVPSGASSKLDFIKNVISSGIAFLPIESIEPADSDGKYVYDLEVEDNHTFVAGAGNICVHNCGGMFDRLAENRFDEKYDAILVHLKGQPARCTRRLIKRMNEELNLPVVIFTDGDPWSFRIFASVAYGAIKTAHISEYLATPEAQFLGVTPSDIQNYDLPSDKLSDKDIAALNAELSDPRFNDPFWQGEIKLQLQNGKKAEQQSLAKYGLDFVTDKYLPEKLKEMGII